MVTTIVAVDPDRAFRLFTADVDRWWKRGPRYRPCLVADGRMLFEPGVGGRLLEVYGDQGVEAFEIGDVLVWDPGARLVFRWRGRDFESTESTEVEVRFEPVAGGTRVTVEHRGWSRLPPNHPARHGLEGGAFASMIGLFWGDLLVGLGVAAER